MESIFVILLIFIFLLLFVVRPLLRGANSDLSLTQPSNLIVEKYKEKITANISSSWKFDPHEEKILLQLLSNIKLGISVNELNTLLNIEEKSAENQRQRRHLIIKELNTKLFVLFNVRECIVRIPDSFDSRKKLYSIHITKEIQQELSDFLSN